MGGLEEEHGMYPPVKDRMSRARTPFGAVPISTIYGFDYPLKTGGVEKDINVKHEHLSDAVDYLVRSTRAYSENRLADPYYSSPACSSLSFMPMALRDSRANTPVRDSFRESTVPPVSFPTARRIAQEIAEPPPKTTTVSYESTTPWNSTGFYYSPRYPQSHRGTASTYSQFSRRYPVRRFVPSYVPFRYSRRY